MAKSTAWPCHIVTTASETEFPDGSSPIPITPCALSPTALRSTGVRALPEKLTAKSVPCHVASLTLAYQLIDCPTSSNGPAGCRAIPWVESALGSGS